MRLLEFNRDEGGANPIPANPRSQPKTAPPLKQTATAKTPSPARASTVKKSPKRTKSARQAKVFPLKSVTPPQARRKPIDLEQLQNRVGVLERRIKARTEALGDEVAAKDLEKLKQRMKLLERNINSELWAAKQREYAMLQMMAKPTLKTILKQGYATFRANTIPALLISLGESYRHWWLHSQPGWWPGFAAAWQESLDKARGQHHS
ncbi:MAG: hypothetical protein ABFS24_04390 [Pseudomonadota bacterium]